MIKLWVSGHENIGEGLMWVVTVCHGEEEFNHRFDNPIEAFKYAGFLSVLYDLGIDVEKDILFGVSRWAW